MKITDAIGRLDDMAQGLRDKHDGDLITNPRKGDIEALERANYILSVLETQKDRATAIATALFICRASKNSCPKICPYRSYGQGCIGALERDASDMLELAYMQGGDGDVEP